MEIHNEVVTSEKDVEKKKFVVRSAADVQRAKLEKLMKNPEKPVIIPEQTRERDFSAAIPTFVRNVMGSSAGAGSGEFHVYRHLRRKEYARQKYIQEKSRVEELDDEFQMKLQRNKEEADERTAKKRAKRQKKKAKQKANRGKKPKKDLVESEESQDEVTDSDSDEKQNILSEEKKVPIHSEESQESKYETQVDNAVHNANVQDSQSKTDNEQKENESSDNSSIK